MNTRPPKQVTITTQEINDADYESILSAVDEAGNELEPGEEAQLTLHITIRNEDEPTEEDDEEEQD